MITKLIRSYKRIEEIMTFQNGGGVYIWGASENGRALLKDLLKLNIYVSGFFDNDKGKENSVVLGYPVYRPEKIKTLNRGEFFICLALAKDDSFFSVRHVLESQYGLTEIMDFGDFGVMSDRRYYRDGISFADIPVETYDLRYKALKNTIPRMPDSLSCQITPNDIVIPDLDLKVNTFCTKNCSQCACCTPYIKNKKNFEVNQIADDLDKLLEVSYVASLCFLGGEPLLHPELAALINKVADIKNLKNVARKIIISNGDIIPSDDILSAFSRLNNHLFIVNDYGNTNRKLDAIRRQLEKYHITYDVTFKEEWLYHGEIEQKRMRKKDELKHLYMLCQGCASLYNGKFYTCGRAASLIEENIVNGQNDDYIDVRNCSPQSLRGKIFTYYYSKPYLSVCDYCDGKHIGSKQIPMGS